jgi:hypothetical protein
MTTFFGTEPFPEPTSLNSENGGRLLRRGVCISLQDSMTSQHNDPIAALRTGTCIEGTHSPHTLSCLCLSQAGVGVAE